MRAVMRQDMVDENRYDELVVTPLVPVKRGRGQRRTRRTRNTVRVKAGWVEVRFDGPPPGVEDGRFAFTLTLT